MHAENAYGLARVGQTIVNLPDASVMELFVDDEPLFLPTARLGEYQRVLDMRDGTLARDLLWTTPAGKHVRVRSCRLVSLEHRHVAAMSYEVTVDRRSPIVIASRVVNHGDLAADRDVAAGRGVDPRVGRSLGHRVLRPCLSAGEDGRLLLGYRAENSGMTLSSRSEASRSVWGDRRPPAGPGHGAAVRPIRRSPRAQREQRNPPSVRGTTRLRAR